MKNFENLENLWRQQAVVGPVEPQKIRSVQSAAARIVQSRGRLLRWGIAVTAFALVVLPVLTVANAVYGGRTPNLVALVNVTVLELLQLGFLIVLVRRLRAYRQSRAKSSASICEGMSVSLEIIEREIREYRVGLPLFVLALLFDTVPVFNGYHQGYFDAPGMIHRLGFIFGLGIAMLSVGLRHYRNVLRPQQAQLQSILGDLQAS